MQLQEYKTNLHTCEKMVHLHFEQALGSHHFCPRAVLKSFAISQFTLSFSLILHLTKAQHMPNDLSPSLLSFAEQRAAQASCPESALSSREAVQAEPTKWGLSFADGQ